jgi:uncharacterized membrane protein
MTKGANKMANVYEAGNTIILSALFKDNVGNPTELDTHPTLTVYDANYEILNTYSLDINNLTSTGSYEFFYTIPLAEGLQNYFYEFKGIIKGTVGLNRGQFSAKFVI